MMKDSLGDRMKKYEQEFNRKISKDSYFCIRLDGRNFSKLSKYQNFNKPFDDNFKSVMNDISSKLVCEMNAWFSYNQSDEISLYFKPVESEFGQQIFDGKVQKLLSVSSGIASSMIGSKFENAHFDSRLFVLPDEFEVWNNLLWRQQDCHRNAVNGIAQSRFSQKQLNKVTIRELKQMIPDWSNYPDCFLYGTIHNRCETFDLSDIIHTMKIEDNYQNAFTRSIINE